ncbi:KTSC domain-containing protein [Sphingopyxis sp. GW247-27LB]|uniref:KTSC domain-containing protein n=1 Tax=Sphingopyxis sp. GW247-27LB TaxID=2012632 RepID=UPI000BA51226|nr:KTSC domain-containing protein [Sphingopyxis sp. GW247-27LB]PAL23702.1 hypothetical protein CD928_05955 [Sphingopyxis sp. GW247-27LB]
MRTCDFADSALIDGAAYDDAARVLCLRFREAGCYYYFDVPTALFDGLCAAASAGRYFNAHIKNRFRCERDPERRGFGPKGRGRPIRRVQPDGRSASSRSGRDDGGRYDRRR